MSVTGVWLVTTVPEERVREWHGRFAGALAQEAAARRKMFAWWRTVAEEPFVESSHDLWRLTDIGLRFLEASYAQTDEELAGEIMAAADAAGEEGRFVASARKGSPAAALAYALGCAEAARLPGALGEFLLSRADVLPALAEAEQVLDLSGERRASVAERIGQWLEAGADEPGFDAVTLLDGPLRLFRRAAAEHTGLAGTVLWF
jgi:hypothetical protein